MGGMTEARAGTGVDDRAGALTAQVGRREADHGEVALEVHIEGQIPVLFGEPPYVVVPAAVALLIRMSSRPKESIAASTMSAAPAQVAEVLLACRATHVDDLGTIVGDGVGVRAGPKADIVDEHAGALAGQEECVLAADPAARPGHDRYLAVEPSHGHAWSPMSCCTATC